MPRPVLNWLRLWAWVNSVGKNQPKSGRRKPPEAKGAAPFWGRPTFRRVPESRRTAHFITCRRTTMILPSVKNVLRKRAGYCVIRRSNDRSSVAASRMSSDSLQEGRIGIAIRREANGPLVRTNGSPRSQGFTSCHNFREAAAFFGVSYTEAKALFLANPGALRRQGCHRRYQRVSRQAAGSRVMEGNQHSRRQSIIDSLLAKANKAAFGLRHRNRSGRSGGRSNETKLWRSRLHSHAPRIDAANSCFLEGRRPH